jgi:sulfatase maturation enzyme AslB (radical SAM superfamily)
MSSTFCPAPWVARILHSDGTSTPCCYTKEQNIDLLKAEFLAGMKPKQCSYCWYREDNNLHSPRHDIINFANGADTIKLLSINLGNYCNAECITCNGNSSSKRNMWAKKHSPVEFIKQTISASEEQLDFSQYPNLSTIILIGGEPMLHPNTKPLLKKIIELGIAKDITISFNTNASLFDSEIIDLLTQFKSIAVTLSIDGAGVYFNYQRRPLLWNSVKDISLQWMNISESIVINYVVSAVSVWGFNDFVSWFSSLPESIQDKNPEVTFTHVTDKLYLTLNVLTEEQKAEWVASASEHRFKQSVIDILSSAEFSPMLVGRLREQIKLEDINATIKFAEIFPNWKLNA